MSKWIGVKEDLPKIGEVVVGMIQVDDIKAGCIITDMKLVFLQWNGFWRIKDEPGFEMQFRVVYWTSIPEQPEVK